MSKVVLERVAEYDPNLVAQGVERVLAPLGGIEKFVLPGERVLLKPNLLAAKSPEAAVTTHPEVVRAVVKLVQRAGGIPIIGDSPGYGSYSRITEKTGLSAVARETGAQLVEFSDSVEVQGSGTFRRFEIARPYLEADRIINLPKLKTHEMMTITCAVKNLFGAVVGARKAAWHLKAGSDRELFARMLVELSLLRVPDLTIVDAVIGMEGNGPGSGDPRHVGVLLAGTDPVAVDVVAAELAGIPRKLLYVERAARELGLPGSDRSNIELAGSPLEELRGAPFRLPHISDVQFGLPRFLKNRLRHYFTSRPCATERCRMCGICIEACPPRAISIEEGKLKFDYQRCIHCFCCRELCPDAALAVKQGLVLRLAAKIALIKTNFNRG
ncbi:DUF362 domain-containing protein [Geobacter sp. DSM 9736]|uniref:DUF362 domain-containing protein n=1 Tax=Geobacter sp. DSM 9736 TaxID=1277350 RepID=UPI000B50B757|nr:DUF362 domain-containing protein [Geobacter sp. DSM 9736]SNB46842.1 Uncharacterized conserved protein, DUF362 family [Geobacter sp. DSM 9736]